MVKVYLLAASVYIDDNGFFRSYPQNALLVEYANTPTTTSIEILTKENRTSIIKAGYQDIRDSAGVAYGVTQKAVFDALNAFISTPYGGGGTPITGFATEINQVNGLQRTKITDGTTDCTITNNLTPGNAAQIKFKQDALSVVGTEITITDPSLVGSPFTITGGIDWVPQATIPLDLLAISAALNTVVTGWTTTGIGEIIMTKNVLGFFAGLAWGFNNLPLGAFSIDSIYNGANVTGTAALDVFVVNNVVVDTGLQQPLTDTQLRASPVVVAESAGTLWQRLANTGFGYAVATPSINIALAVETDFVLLKNPIASGKLVRFWEQLLAMQGSTPSQSTIIRVYMNPTITTNGTAMTVAKLRSSLGIPSVVQAFYSPTISARGTLMTTYMITTGTFTRELDLARFMEENATLLFTAQPTNTTTPHTFSAAWAEV